MRERLHIVEAVEKRSFAAGSVVQMMDAAAGLAGRGHRVTVVSRPSDGVAARCEALGIDHVGMPLAFRYDLLSARRLARLARSSAEPVVVHAHESVSHSVALLAARLGAPFGLVVDRGVSFPLGYISGMRFRSRRIDRVVAVSESVRDTVVRTGRVPEDKVAVVYGGVDVDRFGSGDGAAFRAACALPEGTRLVGYSGAWNWKGWNEVMRAFHAVRKELPSAHLVIVGCRSPKRCEGVLDLAREMGMAEAVTATLARDDMPDFFAACDVFVDASWAGTGITGTLREAMAAGTPVVATRISGNPELVEDGESGILVPPREVPTLAAAILRLLVDARMARRLGAAGRRRVRRSFTTAARVRRLEALYREVAAAGRGDRDG